MWIPPSIVATSNYWSAMWVMHELNRDTVKGDVIYYDRCKIADSSGGRWDSSKIQDEIAGQVNGHYIPSASMDGNYSNVLIGYVDRYVDSGKPDIYRVKYVFNPDEGDSADWDTGSLGGTAYDKDTIDWLSVASAGSNVYMFWIARNSNTSNPYGQNYLGTYLCYDSSVDNGRTWTNQPHYILNTYPANPFPADEAISVSAAGGSIVLAYEDAIYSEGLTIAYRGVGPDGQPKPWELYPVPPPLNEPDSVEKRIKYYRPARIGIGYEPGPMHPPGMMVSLVGPAVQTPVLNGPLKTGLVIHTLINDAYGHMLAVCDDTFDTVAAPDDTASFCGDCDWVNGTGPWMRITSLRGPGSETLWLRDMQYTGASSTVFPAVSSFNGYLGTGEAARGVDGSIREVKVGGTVDSLIYLRGLTGSEGVWYPIGSGTMPTVAMNGDMTFICYVQHESLFALCQVTDTTWSPVLLATPSGAVQLGPPSLAVFQGSSGRLGNVVVPVYNQTTHQSEILFVQFDASGDVQQNVVDQRTGFADSLPSIACGVTDSVYVTYTAYDTAVERALIHSPTDQNPPGA
jgi:hypothetical protein